MRSSSVRKRVWVIAAMVVGGLLLMTVLAPQGALAHERVIRGHYLFVIGWTDEPPLVGFKNSLDLSIFNNSTGTPVPVLNAENNLTVKFVYGSKNKTVDLIPVVSKPGYYGADIIPTLAGTYMVNLTGRVEKQPVNLNQALDVVEWPTTIEFPSPRPTPENTSGAANGAQLMASYGVALGAGGLILGAAGLAVALISRRRHREG
jgi:hypothetical protein